MMLLGMQAFLDNDMNSADMMEQPFTRCCGFINLSNVNSDPSGPIFGINFSWTSDISVRAGRIRVNYFDDEIQTSKN